MSSEKSKPRVLILGGCGFIARHLVKHLVKNNLAAKIRVVDKTLPSTAYLNKEFTDYYKNVEHIQANLSNPAHVKKAFDDKSGKYDYVVNLAAETRFGKEENIYQQMVYNLSVNCAKEAASVGCKKYIEVSTAQVYKPSSKNVAKENSTIAPWTLLAKYKKQAEDDIKKMEKLPWMILRPSNVYGEGDMNGLMPRVICAATYTSTKEKMKLLWTSGLKINCVHVTDCASAIWHLWENGKQGDIYNLSDKSDLNQGKFNAILEEIFNIKTGFLGSLLSSAAKLKWKDAVDTANETHMNPWSEMTKKASISFTPLSPYIDQELLYNNSLNVDGSAIEKVGFKYQYPKISSDLVISSVKYFEDLNLFPKVRAK